MQCCVNNTLWRASPSAIDSYPEHIIHTHSCTCFAWIHPY